MFYRRKIILALLQAFGNGLPLLKLYKLLFLVTKQQEKPEYDFVPYSYGCYSFSLHADLEVMCKRGILNELPDKSLHKPDKKCYFSELREKDKKIILSIQQQFVNSSTNDLIRYTYTHYPYTAIRSKVAKKLLSPGRLKQVNAARPTSEKTILFTIGYEGISLEEYLNRLLKNDVRVLVDVRCNPVSMKFGFSKSQLKNYCTNLQIEYVHIPEVGIHSDLRQELNSQADYDKLFLRYEKENLTETINYQEKIFELLESKKRIALTCFEADICKCHRKHLSEAITKLPAWKYELNHI